MCTFLSRSECVYVALNGYHGYHVYFSVPLQFMCVYVTGKGWVLRVPSVLFSAFTLYMCECVRVEGREY